MNVKLKRVLQMFRNFGKPDFELGDDSKLREADELHKDLEAQRRQLEIRLRLATIKASPRGELHG